jgi:hypothetical protein
MGQLRSSKIREVANLDPNRCHTPFPAFQGYSQIARRCAEEALK